MYFKIVPLFFFIFLIGLINAVAPLPPSCTAEGGVCTTNCDEDDRIADASCTIEGNFCCKAGKRNFAHCTKVNRQCRLGGGRCVPNGRVKYNNCPYLGDAKSCCKNQTCCIGPQSSTCLVNTQQCIAKNGSCVKSDDCFSPIPGDFCGPSCPCCLQSNVGTCGSTTLSNCTGVNGTCKAQCLTIELLVDHGCSNDLCQCCQPCEPMPVCKSHNGICIALNSTCNGVIMPNNCTTDKCQCCVNIPTHCPQFKCSDGTLIPATERCDDKTDCADNSDELYCDLACNLEIYTCINGSTIQGSVTCDGIDDCSHGEDEINCGNCSKTYNCTDGSHIIPSSLRCDGSRDCVDGDDEENCGCTKP